jgi:hypothetical protein
VLHVLDRDLLGHVHGVVVDEAVAHEGVLDRDREVEHLAVAGVLDAGHRTEVEVVPEHRTEPLGQLHPWECRNPLERTPAHLLGSWVE